MPGLTHLVIAHPLGGIRPDAVKTKAAAAVDDLESLLLGRR
jgi:propanediol dehydratase small subunit